MDFHEGEIVLILYLTRLYGRTLPHTYATLTIVYLKIKFYEKIKAEFEQ